MTILERIVADMKQAMRDKNEVARDTLRMLKSDVGRRELELGRAPDDAEVTEVLLRAVKTRRESLEQYEQGGRADLAEKERKEVAIIEAYLPKTMDEAEARTTIEALAKELSASQKKDMGRLMKEITARYRGQIDGKVASKIAGEILQ
ncbi:MAG: GatB/YqeY domain-containing protein [Polyangiales bacterium]|nr:GatB/YqeY domain-containing protein [Myxococcales bacterium]